MKPSGAKLWYLAYRYDGKQRKLTIGPYPRVTLKDARTRRVEAKRLLDQRVEATITRPPIVCAWSLVRCSALASQAGVLLVIQLPRFNAIVTPTVRHRAAIISRKALGELLRAMDGHPGMPEVRTGLQLLALTFVRPGELRRATWTEIDFDADVWQIPAERMKMRRPHRVPLARQTIEPFRHLKELPGHSAMILCGARGQDRSLSENTFNAALSRLGYSKDEMTAHGFRAAASSILNESGQWNPDAIEAQLAHVESNAIRRAYARGQSFGRKARG